jgi:tRNA modification GTPase
LELDFSEEDVEFADRQQFENLLERIVKVLKYLIDSFSTGNVIKNGVPISIIGAPNVGKSTLLNTLLNEDKAIVSNIAGTTRDAIEDELSIEGIKFRFIDTAGIRQTEDTVEAIGIEKTYEKIAQSQVILQLFDANDLTETSSKSILKQIKDTTTQYPDKQLLVLINKMDTSSPKIIKKCLGQQEFLGLSAKTGEGVDVLKAQLLGLVKMGKLRNNDTIITNARHFDALGQALNNIQNVQKGLQTGLSGDLLAIDIREALYHFGRITGEISTDDLLGNIFSNFCIGK